MAKSKKRGFKPAQRPLWIRPYERFMATDPILRGIQAALLTKMHDHGCLPESPNAHALGSNVIGLNSERGTVSEVSWCAAYAINGQNIVEHCYQESELRAVRK